MQYPSALAACAVEGAVVFGEYNTGSTLVAGPKASQRGGPGGTAIGRFAWVTADGFALNAREIEGQPSGIVLPPGPLTYTDWRAVFFDSVTETWRIREGLALTMLVSGNIRVRFPYGSYRGDIVYSNVLDGSAMSGYSAQGELTPWSVLETVRPGGLAVISTWSKFT